MGVVPWVREAIQRYGPIGTVKYVGLCAWERLPVHPWNRPDDFDRAHGVDTHRKVRNADLRIDSPWAQHGSAYQPIHPKAFHELVRSVEIDFARCTFVDFGSGKGRALLFASDYPFARILGVEFAPELHAIAVENVRRYRGASQRCFDIEPVLADATTFALPPGPLVLYFYHPFHASVMERVVANVERSLRDCPRSVTILYYDPVDRHLWDGSTMFEAVQTRDRYVVYRSRAGLEEPERASFMPSQRSPTRRRSRALQASLPGA